MLDTFQHKQSFGRSNSRNCESMSFACTAAQHILMEYGVYHQTKSSAVKSITLNFEVNCLFICKYHLVVCVETKVSAHQNDSNCVGIKVCFAIQTALESIRGPTVLCLLYRCRSKMEMLTLR